METIIAALKIQNPDSEKEEKMAQVEEEKKEDKKIELRISGGGIGGLLVLGGVVAAAALLAALRNRRKRPPTNKIIKDPSTDPSEGQEFSKEGGDARSVVQTPSLSEENHQSKEEASIIHSTTLASSDSMATKSLVMEESSQINVEAEKPKSVNEEMDLDNVKRDLPAADDYDTTNKGILTEQKECDQNKENTGDAAPVDTVTFTQNIDKGEENPSPQLFDNNNNEKDEEEGSDGTVDSSMESNAEAIWPAEITERPLETEIKSHIKNSGKTIANEADNDAYMRNFFEVAKDETCPVKMTEKKELQSHQSSRFVVLVSSMVWALLLFILNHIISKSYVPSVSRPFNATQRH